MTESLWNKYDIFHKSLEVPVRRGTCTECIMGFHCDGLKNMRVDGARIFIVFIIIILIIITLDRYVLEGV